MKRSLQSAISLLLLITLLLPAALRLESVAAAGTQFLYWDDIGNETYARFGPGTQIMIGFGKIEFQNFCPPPDGENDYIYPASDVYIVPSGSVADEGDLEDLSGEPNTIVTDAGGAFIGELIGVTQGSVVGVGNPISTGVYAVVYDECQDGKFNQGTDFVLDPAFEVTIPANLPILPSGRMVLLKAKAEIAYRAYEQEHKWLEKYFESATMADRMNPTSRMLWGLGKLPFLADPRQVALLQVLNQAKHWKGIAADPPDPDFKQHNPLLPREPIVAGSDEALALALAGLGEATADDAALAEAYLRALERYQGAALAGDGQWGLIHARAIRDYGNLLADQLPRGSAALADLEAAIAADPHPSDDMIAELEAFRARVVASGFTPEETQAARNLGLTDADLNGIRSRFAAQSYDFTRADLLDTLAAARANHAELAEALRGMSAEMGTIVAQLEATPEVGNMAPIARAGGPYSGAEGAPVAFNGGASSSRYGPITAYAWDLDGDGEFDDATGATPAFTYDRAFKGLIGLKVTNTTGLSGVAYAPITIAETNRPPMITGGEPTDPWPQIVIGESLPFGVTATDPDGDAVSGQWFLDGAQAGDGLAFTYTPAAAAVGPHWIEARVTDGQPHGGATVRRWQAIVVRPDADGDGWRANADCDDADPAVYPGRLEVIGNGKDDDCDPSTTDTGSAPTAAFNPQPQDGGRNVALLEAGAKIVAVTSQAAGAAATEMLDHPANDAPWRTTGNVNQSATVELIGGKTYLIDRVQLRLGANDGTNRVRNFEVAVAENLAGPYTTVLAATAADTAELQDFPLSKPVAARYVRYTPLTNRGGPHFATQQLKVFTGQEGSANVAFTDRSTDPDSNLVSRLWDFGDGQSSAEQHPTHTYAAAGTYNVTLTVTDAAGQTSSATLPQRVLTAPVASFTADPDKLKEGPSTTLRPQASDPDGGAILAINWHYGDGSTPQTFGPGSVVAHEFPDNGVYTVTMEAVDDQGQVGRVQQTLTIANVAPTATFVAPKLAVEGQTATLTLKSATDVGDADKTAGFTYAFDCGSGYAAPTASNSTSCLTTGAATFTFKGKVIDKDGGETEYTATAKTASITLTPAALTVVPGTQARLSAKVTDPSGAPMANVQLDLVLTGDNNVTPQGTTDANGVANFAYSSSLSGLDRAVARERGHTASSNEATITWAQPSADVLILSTTVGGGATGGGEGAVAKSLGLSIEVIAPNGWGAKTTADFAKYKAIILGDGGCRSLSVALPAQNNTAVWGAALTGNVLIVGTDNDHHYPQGGKQLMERGIAFAAGDPGKTGAFLSLSCYYHGVAPGTPVWLLDGVAPGLTARGVGCYNDSHIVATHPALEGLTDGNLSNWSCSVHEAFDNWPSDFQVLAIAEGIGGSYTAPDGTTGTPYIVARGRDLVPISAIKLTPKEATKPVGGAHAITATVAEGGTPTPGRAVTFTVLSGPHAGQTGTATTAADGTATFTYTGTTAGTDTVEAKMVDGAGKTQTSNRVTVTWGTAPNSAPVVNAGPDAAIVAGGAFAGAGSLTDPDADTWTATVDYGDGQGAQPLALSGKDFTLGHTYAAAGTYTVTVVVDDGKGGVGADTLVVTVSAPANGSPVVSAGADATSDEGSAFAAAGSFADADADTWTATVDYGDGGGAQPLTLNGKDFALNHTYADNGTYTITVAVSDGKGTGTDTLVVTVANVAPTATLSNNGPVAIGAAAAVSFANPTDPSSVDTTAGLRYAFACDGAALDGATYAGAGATPSTTCAFDVGGSQTVRARVIDKDGGFTERTTVVVVDTPANKAPTVVAGPDQAGDEGAAIALAGTATDPEGATLTLAWTAAAPAGTCRFADPAAASTTVTCADNGVYTVTFTADDGVNPPVAASATVTVANVAPTATFVAPAAVTTGNPFTLALNGATDPSGADADAGFQYAFDCGDGAGYGPLGAATTRACPTTAAGSRAVKGKVQDKDGGAREYSATVGVADAPPPPPAGAALRFNGKNQSLRVADHAALRLQAAVTLEAFARPASVAGSKYIAGKGDSYKLSIEPAGAGYRAVFYVSVNGTFRTVKSATLPLNQWHHLAGVYDGATLRLFVDGQPVAERAAAGKVASSNKPFRIGSVYADADYFAGIVDEVRVSSSARYTVAFDRPTAPFAPDAQTVGLWHLDEGTGATAADASGNGRTGTLVNNPAWATDTPFAPAAPTGGQPAPVAALRPSEQRASGRDDRLAQAF